MAQTSASEISAGLTEVADLLDLAAREPALAAACRKTGRLVRAKGPAYVAELQLGRWDLLPAGGQGVQQIVEALLEARRPALADALARDLGPSLVRLLGVPRLRASQLRVLHERWGITSRGQLEMLAGEKTFLHLPGGGVRTAQVLLKGLVEQRQAEGVWLFEEAAGRARQLIERLSRQAGVLTAAVTGALRRAESVVDRIELLVAGPEGPVVECLGPGRQVLREGGVLVFSGGQDPPVSVRLATAAAFGSALVATSSDDEHLRALGERAEARGYLLDRNGLQLAGSSQQRRRPPLPGQGWLPFAPARSGNHEAAEAGFYAAMGLPPVPPELRTGAEILERAERGQMPRQLERGDLKGAIHLHTESSVGMATLEQYARHAVEQGLSWLVVTDHLAPRAGTGCMGPWEFEEQSQQIRKVSESCGVEILAGVEVEIRCDGSLAAEEELLEEADFVLASIRRSGGLNPADQTRRVLTALENPRVSAIAHPTGRVHADWPGIRCAWERVFRTAADRGVPIEINLHPQRRDPDREICRVAADAGCVFALGVDARRVREIDRQTEALAWVRRTLAGSGRVINTAESPAVRRGEWR